MLNWKIRYARLIDRNRELLDPANSVLEIGSGQHGIATYLKRPVTGIEPIPAASQCEWLTLLQGDARSLPFADGQFGYVVCVDVLEHVPPQDRAQVISEMLRVAGKRLILSCPIRQHGEIGEAQLAAWFDARHGGRPDWLAEHLTNGLPGLDELVSIFAGCGNTFELFGNEGMLQHYGGLLLEHEFPLSHQLLAFHDRKTVFEPPLGNSDWDLYYSYAFCIDKKFPVRHKSATIPQSAAEPTEGMVLYAACHDVSLLSDFGKVTPLLTGAAADNAPQGMLTDILQDGSRLLNSRWSELSGIYKIWREGPRSAVIGFSHYRRLFDFSGEAVTGYQRSLSKEELAKRRDQLFDEQLIRQCADNTVIVPRPFQLINTPWNQYSYDHNASDFCLIVSLISERAPELLPYLDNLMTGRSLYAFNMFIMNWRLFDTLCHTWFDILLEFERRVPAGRALDYQNRDISFLSERIFDAWIRYAQDHQMIELKELPIFYVES
jgi:hypothetical protein